MNRSVANPSLLRRRCRCEQFRSHGWPSALLDNLPHHLPSKYFSNSHSDPFLGIIRRLICWRSVFVRSSAGMSAIMPFGLSLGNMVLWGLRGGGRSRSTMVSLTKGVPGCQTQGLFCITCPDFPVKALSGKVPVLLNKQALPFIREVI